VKQYVKHFAGSHTFSNGLSPAQAAAVLKAVEIVRSPEGEKLRGDLFRAIGWLRDALGSHGIRPLGDPSPIVPVVIGDERLARVAHKLLFARNVAANCVEFPIVESGMARFRLQVMARHEQEHARFAARAVADTLAEMEEVARKLQRS
jgi:glycine C-acetyltransferase/8-amino-7-oxononanoate synthase